MVGATPSPPFYEHRTQETKMGGATGNFPPLEPTTPASGHDGEDEARTGASPATPERKVPGRRRKAGHRRVPACRGLAVADNCIQCSRGCWGPRGRERCRPPGTSTALPSSRSFQNPKERLRALLAVSSGSGVPGTSWAWAQAAVWSEPHEAPAASRRARPKRGRGGGRARGAGGTEGGPGARRARARGASERAGQVPLRLPRSPHGPRV